LHSAPQSQGAAPTKDPLKEQTDDLQRQIAEFKQMAETVQQATREQANPLDNTLKELTQQVSAIREYAATQQNRVEKLQDGYDWGIIRTFCLRVIRCVDNLESRLANLPKGDAALTHLEEIKDELLFALESSGVEQFQEGVGRLLDASLDRIGPLRRVRQEADQLRERLARLEQAIAEIEAQPPRSITEPAPAAGTPRARVPGSKPRTVPAGKPTTGVRLMKQ
jgi:molecular chaperone GrpE (heat shock protein)